VKRFCSDVKLEIYRQHLNNSCVKNCVFSIKEMSQAGADTINISFLDKYDSGVTTRFTWED
jgi:hypothetical protein